MKKVGENMVDIIDRIMIDLINKLQLEGIDTSKLEDICYDILDKLEKKYGN